jgi:hypothetical protein
LGFYEGKTDSIPQLNKVINHIHTPFLVIGLSLVYLIVVTMGAVYFTKWYLKKLYGNYLDELKDTLQELGE